jgi:hypothetical protein
VTNAAVGLEAVLKQIPVKFTGKYDNTQQAFENFCRNYTSIVVQKNSFSLYEERIVRRAYDSFDNCVKLVSQGVSITHEIVSGTALNFFLAPAAQKPISISGVVTSANVTCSGNVPTDKGLSFQPLKPDSSFKVADIPFSFVCTRTGSADNNTHTTTFEEGSVQVLTNWGNYTAVWPQDRVLAQASAQAIATEFDNLRQTISAVDQRITGIQLEETAVSAGPDFSCSHEDVANKSLTFMVGLKDGTGCGVLSKNYYKTISLKIPGETPATLAKADSLIKTAAPDLAKMIDDDIDAIQSENARVGRISLSESTQSASAEFRCGQENSTSRPLEFLVGRYDSTAQLRLFSDWGFACGPRKNVNYSKQLDIRKP